MHIETAGPNADNSILNFTFLRFRRAGFTKREIQSAKVVSLGRGGGPKWNTGSRRSEELLSLGFRSFPQLGGCKIREVKERSES
ncbi:hypothetical protein Zmor_013059 [Zophobas morio]|uniref:Uncharacterized protein n=1 Tax=Zophobas morio TaxID=2755281 RepID=A0AA38MEV5_9CUCU|nr:hypothetical protein Zmor_013059 [Zophobas morio]